MATVNIKRPLPKHLTPVTGSVVLKLIAWHTSLDIAAYQTLTGKKYLYIKGQLIETDEDPVVAVQNYMRTTPKQAADCVRVFFKIELWK